jgi:hypothetical protein
MIKAKVIGIVMGSLMLLGGAGIASAANGPDWGRDCERRIEHRRFELDRAVRDHGFYSRQAEHERRDLARARYECR